MPHLGTVEQGEVGVEGGVEEVGVEGVNALKSSRPDDHIVMAYIVMAYVVMALESSRPDDQKECRHLH